MLKLTQTKAGIRLLIKRLIIQLIDCKLIVFFLCKKSRNSTYRITDKYD